MMQVLGNKLKKCVFREPRFGAAWKCPLRAACDLRSRIWLGPLPVHLMAFSHFGREDGRLDDIELLW